MRRWAGWLKARADNVAAALLAAMFLTFVIQIVSRYVLNAPVGWTVELCLTLWLWLVFWGSAFCLDDRDHVKFDMLYLAAGQKIRRLLALGAAIVIVVAMLAALPATLDYITFYKIKKSAVLRIRLDYVFAIYGVFAVAVIVRYTWRAVALVRGAPPDTEPFGQHLLSGDGEGERR